MQVHLNPVGAKPPPSHQKKKKKKWSRTLTADELFECV